MLLPSTVKMIIALNWQRKCCWSFTINCDQILQNQLKLYNGQNQISGTNISISTLQDNLSQKMQLVLRDDCSGW